MLRNILKTSLLVMISGITAIINYFYKKVLFLKDRLNTKTVNKIALKGYTFLENYLEQFLKERNFELSF